ncbi:hypothetical protein DFR29_11583 [Tahibacter aquaticus]|uniref:Uncharacterized protein n=1 Tax=Tahibacter aquaticus TaxID=520092 RepID=A0A4R6YPN2_9GAMM|nr:hypothetical protein [Tahibacter aquaticus]TDR39695.1 hypothetical protein DFR29_11583 [Tahibacter aquaticus]
MDERIARLKTPQDAHNLAANAKRLGRPDLEAEALQRASELKAAEEGYISPAQQAIALALYAYEDEQSRLKGRTFRANRTRQMLERHGVLAAAERMVLTRKPSTGYEVLEEAGLQELSFESIIDRFPTEFSPIAVEAARARLEGKPLPRAVRQFDSPASTAVDKPDELFPVSSAVLDDEARIFVQGCVNPSSWFQTGWLPDYRKAVATIARAMKDNRPEDAFVAVWRTQENSISSGGQGMLSYETVDRMREELIQVIRDIHMDGSPANFDRTVERFEGWKTEGRIEKVPRLLIARAFAGVHPVLYHTTVDGGRHTRALDWFVQHTGFVMPRSDSWAARARALTMHLDRAGIFDDDLARNMFPWFVIEQLNARILPPSVPPGHRPRAAQAVAHLPEATRILVLRHNILLSALFESLVSEFGRARVWTEFATGTGGFADAVALRPDGRWQVYEIKIADTAAEVVRQAMGQLLEYGFRTGGLEPLKLVAVGEPALDGITDRFLTRLRSEFNLDIDYLQIDVPALA